MSSRVLLVGIAFVVLGLRVGFFYQQPSSSPTALQGEVSSIPKINKNKVTFSVGHYQVTSNNFNVTYQDQVKLAGDSQGYHFYATSTQIIPESGFQKTLKELRLNLNKKIAQYFPQPERALLSGILLGIKADLPTDFKQALINTGTIHVVVVSGYNIALVGSFFLVLAPLFGRKKTTLLALIGIISYGLLVGASAPTVRAVIMGVVGFSAIILGRKAIALYSLLLSAYLMLLVSPENLTDLSFQLTFMATLGVVLFTSHLESWFKSLPKLFLEALSTTLAAQILVIPLLFYYFGTVSLVSPLVNAAVLWTVPLTTIAGFIFLGTTYLSNFLASVSAELLLLPLTIFVKVVLLFGQSFQFLVVNFNQNNLITTVGYYLLVGGLVVEYGFFGRRKTKN